MNKTLTINISGVVFHIEEDAFEKLSKYLSTIKGYFKDSEGRDEIMADIEARIAEILQEKTGQAKQVVVMADVDQVMAALGKPEEFADGTSGQENTETQQESASARRRRVFRDPDDKVLGGVCSGISSYFDIDPIWMRLAFVAAFLLGGSGFILYIIMWIVIPVAKTTAEKLEMKGENVNIGNIKKTVDEELGHIKKHVSDIADEAGKLGKKTGVLRNRGLTDRFIEFIRTVVGGIFRVIGKIFAVFFIIICTAMLIGFIGSFFGWAKTIHFNHNDVFVYYSFQEFMGMVFNDGNLWILSLISVSLFVGIPLLMILYKSIKILFNIKSTSGRFFKITMTTLWLAGMFLGSYVAMKMLSEFSDQSSNRQTLHIEQPMGDTLYLKVNRDYAYESDGDDKNKVMIDDWVILSENGKKIHLGYPKLDIIPGNSDSFELVVTRLAKGGNRKDANDRARQINYHIEQNDSLLVFDPYFEIDMKNKWRGQEVRAVLKVPKNKVVHLSGNMDKIMYDIDNVSNTWDGDMAGRRWIMTGDGLECIDCEGIDISSSISDRIDRNISSTINEHINRKLDKAERLSEKARREAERERDRALRDAERALEDAQRKLEKLKDKQEEKEPR